MKRLKIFLIIYFAILGMGIQAQDDVFGYTFSYDDNGNRLQRSLIILENPETFAAKTIIEDDKDKSEEETMERGEIPVVKFNDLEAIIYPNPTKGELIIELLNFDEVNDGMILISDMQGRIIYSEKKINKKTSIDLSMHPAGNYLLRINANKLQKEWTILKQ